MVDQEKQKKFVLTAAFYGIILCALYFSVKLLISPMLPFLAGFLVAWLLHGPSVFLAERLHLKPKIPAVVLTAVFYILAFILIAFIGVQIGVAAKDVFPKLPGLFNDQILPFISSSMEQVKGSLGQFDPSISSMIDAWFSEMTSSLSQSITTVSTYIIKLMSNIAMGTPEMILRIVLTVVSTFFMSMDFEKIVCLIKRLLPERYHGAIGHAKEKAVTSIVIFIRAYTVIFLLTFAELGIGFWLLKIPYAGGLGFLVAVVDIMPILGTGLVLLPWALVAGVMGNMFLAIGMVALYVVITAIRNVVEPKLVGRKIGLHPLATLISMFVGLQLFGILGMFLFPLLLSLGVQFKRDGLLQSDFAQQCD